MEKIKNISVLSAVVHVLDNRLGEPQLADVELELTPEVYDFFQEHILSCAKASGLKLGKSTDESGPRRICSRVIEDEGDFIEESKALAGMLFQELGSTSLVRSDLAFCLFVDEDSDQRHVALINMVPVQVFDRRLVREDGSSQIRLERLHVLPDPGRPQNKTAIYYPEIPGAPFDLLYRDAPYSKDDDEATANYWRGALLRCIEVQTPKEMTQIVIRETDKWLENNEELVPEELGADLRKAVKESAVTDEVMDILKIAERMIDQDDLRDSYVGRLQQRGLTRTSFTPDNDWAERNANRKKYALDDGVTISGPRDAIDDVVQILPKTEDGKTRIVIETRRFVEK
ncbi:MAG: nucleoid-associated protein [Armatimonadota bacterium]|nr:nucleoid-associated protein [Armatimonadota bacterium]